MRSCIDLLSDLLACRAMSSEIENVNKATELLHAHLAENGLYCAVEMIDGRKVLYAATCPGKNQDVLLNAHLDVVAAPDDMFTMMRRDGRLFGRGVDDCQGAAVAIARVLVQLKGRASVGAFFTADEEIGGATTLGMVRRGYAPRKIAIIVDGDYKTMTIAQKGMMVLELKSKGRGGHASAPWSFDNPIDKLLDGYLKLRAAWPVPEPSNQWVNTLAPCVISGGAVENQIPDEASMTVNIRYTKDEDYARILEMVKDVTGLEVIEGRHCPPVVMDSQEPLLNRLLEKMREHLEPDAAFGFMNGATDARHLVGLGVPIAIIGLDGEGAHAKQEWIWEDTIEKVSDMLIDFIATGI